MPEPVTPNPPHDDWLTPRRFAAILALFVFAAYPQVVLGLQTFVYRDFGYFSYPIAFHLRESFGRGEIPLWNPLSYCGSPFLAQWNTQVLYPPVLIYTLLPLSWALPVFCLAHLWLGGFGMFLLARRWTGNNFAAAVAGVAFAFNGLMLNCLMWPATIPGLGWMPWVVWLTERAWREGGVRVIVAALVGALQMLSGAVEVILMTWALLGALWLREFVRGEFPRGWVTLRAGVVVLLVNGLCAAQLLPFFDLLAHSHRQSGFNAATWPMPPTGWGNFIAPLFHCHRTYHGAFAQSGQGWTNNYYVGMWTVALAAWAACRLHCGRVGLLVGLTLFCLVLALGDATPVYPWLREHISVINLMRYPVKFVILPVFTLPLLAAFALGEMRRISTQPPERRLQAAAAEQATLLPPEGGVPILSTTDKAWWVTCATVLLLLANLVWLAYAFPQKDDDWRAMWSNSLARGSVFALLVGLLWLLGRQAQPKRLMLLQAAVLALLWLDVSHHAPQPQSVNPVIYVPNMPGRLAAPRFGEARAMISHEALSGLSHSKIEDPVQDYVSRRFALVHNCNLLDGIPTVNGFFPLELRESKEFLALFYDTSAPDPAPEPLLDFLGVKMITERGSFFDWVARPSAMPLITGGQQPVFADSATTLRRLVQPDFNPRVEVFLPPEAAATLAVTNGATVKISDARFAAQRVEMNVEASAPALVVVAQSYYHLWRAYMDGQPTRVWQANAAFQAVEVPAGAHAIKLVYEDANFRRGAIVSLATLLVCAVLGWLGLRR